MLRRYSSKDLDSLGLGQQKTIGSGCNCDIIIKAEGVASTHAAIEYHLLTDSYWLKDLSLIADTKVNGAPIIGQVELHSGDLLQFGMSQPLVFENNQIFPKHNLNIRCSRPCETDSDGVMLPIVGRQIIPQVQSARVLESRQRIRSAQPKPRYQSNMLALDNISSRNSIENSPNVDSSPRNTAGAIELTSNPIRNGSIGNNLLQRVVRLQAEIARKDEEIMLLSRRMPDDDTVLSHHDSRIPSRTEEFPKISTRPQSASAENKNFELDMYRAFLKVLSSKLQSFNNRILLHPTKDYGDVFVNIYRALNETISDKMTEICIECDNHLEKLGYDAIQRSRLKTLLEDQKRESIAGFAAELEIILPVLKDCSGLSKDCIRACSVFSEWSRDQGDLILSSGEITSTILMGSIKQLKDEFSKSQMSRHWLIPNLSPFLQLIAMDLKRRESGLDKHTQTDFNDEVGIIESNEYKKTLQEDILNDNNEQLESAICSAEDIISKLTRQINKGIFNNKYNERMEDRIIILIGSLQKCLRSNRICQQKNISIAESEDSIISIEVRNEDVKDGYRKLSREESFIFSVDEADEADDDMNDADSEFEEEELTNSETNFAHGSYIPHKRISTISEENIEDIQGEEMNSKPNVDVSYPTIYINSTMDDMDMGVAPSPVPLVPPPSYDECIRVRRDTPTSPATPPPLASDSDTSTVNNEDVEEEKTKEPENLSNVSEKNELEKKIIPNGLQKIQHHSHSFEKASEVRKPLRRSLSSESRRHQSAEQSSTQYTDKRLITSASFDHPLSNNKKKLKKPLNIDISGISVFDRVRLPRPRSATVEKHRFRMEKQKRGISMASEHLGTIDEEHVDLEALAAEGIQLSESDFENLKQRLKSEHNDTCHAAHHGNCVLQMVKKIDQERDEELMRARKEATKNMANWLETSEKPRNICEVSHSAHIQSHINTSTATPIVVQSIPVRSYVFSSPPKIRKKTKSAPTLLQPRMQF